MQSQTLKRMPETVENIKNPTYHAVFAGKYVLRKNYEYWKDKDFIEYLISRFKYRGTKI